MLEIKVEDQQVQQLFKRLLAKTSDLKPVMMEISETMLQAVKDNFDTEGARLGKRWDDLSPATKKARGDGRKRVKDKDGNYKKLKNGKYQTRKTKGTWPGKILQVSGKLLGSISEKYNNTSAIVGTIKPYARIQHKGGKAGKNKSVTIPARPYMELNNRDMEKITNLMKRFLAM